jgi:hypothetical protein
MRLQNVPFVLTAVLFLMSMHAYNACRILHGEEQKLMNKSLLLGSLQMGYVPPSVPNPSTHISASTINSRALMGSLQMGYVPLSVPNLGTNYIPASTIGQRTFVGHNMSPLLGSLQKGIVPPSAPNPGIQGRNHAPMPLFRVPTKI